MESEGGESAMNVDRAQRSWTLLGLGEIVERYWETVGEDLQSEGRDPKTDRPTYQWLLENDYRSLIYALREYHGLSFADFWETELGLSEPDQGYQWGIDHQQTIDSMEGFLNARADVRDWSDRTKASQMYRLDAYSRTYDDVNDTADLLGPVQPESDLDPEEATDACWDTFAALREEYSSRTIKRIHRVARQWYNYLETRHVAAFNPTDGIKDHYGWKGGSNERKNPPLNPEHVRTLFDAATDTRDRLLVTALCAWGLRSGEVASLHEDQLVLAPDEDVVAGPYIQFAERKNGPGTVALVHGLDVARDRIRELTDREEGWNGYLFPSSRSSTGHIRRSTINSWFARLWDAAGLPEDIDGETPVPQMARRFWYDAYSSTMNDILDHQISEIADEQGSADAGTILREYLTEDRRRELRRRFMREHLEVAFGGGSR